MGMMRDAVLLKTIEKAGQTEAELLTALLAEQQRTNQLLGQLLQAVNGPQRAVQSPSWGRG